MRNHQQPRALRICAGRLRRRPQRSALAGRPGYHLSCASIPSTPPLHWCSCMYTRGF